MVLSARPDKAQARAMLKAIELSGVAPSRADVLAAVARSASGNDAKQEGL